MPRHYPDPRLENIEDLKSSVENGRNPRDAKFELAEEIIARFHSAVAASDAKQNFISQFSKGAIPDDIPDVTLDVGKDGLRIANLIKEAQLLASTSEAMRMIKQGAVKIDGEKVSDVGLVIYSGQELIVQVGKRKWAKVTT